MIEQQTEVQAAEQRLKMSYEEFQAWDGAAHAEWVDGEVLVFMPPLTLHQELVGFIYTLLNVYVNTLGLGQVLVAPLEMRPAPDGNAREPDVLFVCQERLHLLDKRRLAGPADLVVEVISEESVARDRVDKFYEYQEAGVQEYWLIDPRPGKERVDFYQLLPNGKFQAALPDSEGRYHAAALPGFWFKPDWLWRSPLPNPLRCMLAIAPAALRDALANDETL
ncbi:MAG: Uma2 family endonuclease [Chloroflexaceae bacterium]|jgi:Uma2 family endonuclease|nr:Uma2 family endonuclease [Chloroflexaceae bacterium]